jgi:GST-like protein
MIDLYYAATGNGFRAAIALEECALEYRPHKVDLSKGEQKTEDYLKLNPMGAIPAMVDHDGPGGQKVTLAQSSAILLYAAEKTGKFLPQDVLQRTRVYQWLMTAATDIGPAGSFIFFLNAAMPDKTPANQAAVENRYITFLRGCEGQLVGREFLCDEISVADLALYPAVAMRRPLIEKAGGFEHLLRWIDRMAARPAIVRAMTF